MANVTMPESPRLGAWHAARCKRHGIDRIEPGVYVDNEVQAVLSSNTDTFEHMAAYRSFRLHPHRVDGWPGSAIVRRAAIVEVHERRTRTRSRSSSPGV